jgi:hypothetical protein
VAYLDAEGTSGGNTRAARAGEEEEIR